MQDARPSESARLDGEFHLHEERIAPGLVVVNVRGDADLHVAPELRERLSSAIDDGAEDLVLDLTETTFLDSMALGVMLGATKRLRARGGRLRLVVSSQDLRRIFEITLLDRVFPLHEDRDEALAAADEALRAGG